MKRIGKIFEKMFSAESLKKAAEDACRNRKDKGEVAAFKENEDAKLAELHESLMNGTYRSSEYRMFTIKENGKEREIADAPLYPDRIVQWAVTNELEPRLNARLIHQTYASVPGRGVKTAIEEINKGRHHPKAGYCLKTDVKKFFRSIDKEKLKLRMRKLVKDKRVLSVIDEIIDGYPEPGIPLGNRTSAMFANQFLSPIDHYFKEVMKCHCYVRYMDDILILGNTPKWLHSLRRKMEMMLNDLGLEMKNNCQVTPLSAGVTFLGYRIFRHHTLVKAKTKYRMYRAAKYLTEEYRVYGGITSHIRAVLASYHGLLMICDSYGLRMKIFGPVYDLIGWMPKGPMKAIP